MDFEAIAGKIKRVTWINDYPSILYITYPIVMSATAKENKK